VLDERDNRSDKSGGGFPRRMRYREQYDRMKRRQARLSEVRRDDVSDQSLLDDALAFFESCLHLRDWIENDEELPEAVRRAARPYVKQSDALALCHDIAIGAKHLTVDRPLAKDAKPQLDPKRIVEERAAMSLQDEDDDDNPYNYLPPLHPVSVISVRLMVKTDNSEPMDAVAFAIDCVREWDVFLKRFALT
jgi:hypothetical protein